MLAWFFSAVLNLPKPQDSLGSVDGNFVVGLKWDHKGLFTGTSLAVQWLLCASTAGDIGSIPSQGTKILHAALSQKKKKIDYLQTYE